MNNGELGLVRVGAAVPNVYVGDCEANANEIVEAIEIGVEMGIEILCFPELSVTGYTCGDLFFQKSLLDKSEMAVEKIAKYTENHAGNMIVIIGAPILIGSELYNCAIAIQGGNILGIVPKLNLPNNGEFYEKRWFTSGYNLLHKFDSGWKFIDYAGRKVEFSPYTIFHTVRYKFAIEICEDVWMPIPPSSYHAINGAQMIFNLSASNELIGKNAYLKGLVKQQSARCNAVYVYASAGWGESSTDVVYMGNGFIAENGSMLEETDRFMTDPQLIYHDVDVERVMIDRVKNTNFTQEGGREYNFVQCEETKSPTEIKREIPSMPFVPSRYSNRKESCEEIFNIQVSGLAKRWLHTGAKVVTVGISGGLDSTLALLVAVKAATRLGYDRDQVIGITMPGFGTTDRTYKNAIDLMKSLGVTSREISIKQACMRHFSDIGHNVNVHDVTYENVQARERTQILMDVANKEGGFVIGTGDLSELALGWATYNGDHMSMYGVNSGIPKTLVKYLIEIEAEALDITSQKILQDVLKTPVSPELLPPAKDGTILQVTEDVVGPYRLHDFFLYHMVRFGFSPSKIFYFAIVAFKEEFDRETIKKWLVNFYKRFFAQQFKRSCMPDGPKVGSINLSPRGDWRMPSDAIGKQWIEEAEQLK